MAQIFQINSENFLRLYFGSYFAVKSLHETSGVLLSIHLTNLRICVARILIDGENFRSEEASNIEMKFIKYKQQKKKKTEMNSRTM